MRDIGGEGNAGWGICFLKIGLSKQCRLRLDAAVSGQIAAHLTVFRHFKGQ